MLVPQVSLILHLHNSPKRSNLHIMQGELQALLQSNEVHDDVIDWLGHKDQSCTSIAKFANFLDDRTQVQAVILDHIAAHRRDGAQRTALKQAWREAEAINNARLKRTAEGLQAEAPEEPLGTVQQNNVLKAFKSHYASMNPNIPNHKMGSDTFLGIVWREFEIFRPKMYDMYKVKSLATAHLAPMTKRSRVGHVDVVSTDATGGGYVAAMPKDKTPPHPFEAYLSLFLILINTWAVAGVKEFVYGVSPEIKKERYCEWSKAQAYREYFAEKGWRLMERHTINSVCVYIHHVEELVRGDAISMARDQEATSKLPWGECLIRAMKREEFWKQEEDTLSKLNPNNKGNSKGNPKGGNAPWKGDPKGGGKKSSKSDGSWQQGGNSKGNPKGGTQTKHVPLPNPVQGFRLFKYSPVDHLNQPICKEVNTNVGCKVPCKKNQKHCCNVFLKDGRICESRNHVRMNHDPAQHGEPQYMEKKRR